ncbi:MAG: peptidoglycan-binding protein, partial [Proteobacteria bacterium]|nr:peptidoglycan-binding protein [Pseudomonadota bacterium]
QGLRVVLIVDEAQELSIESLEQVRLLTNLETPTQKLLQIILLGQPELRDKLHQPQLRQLAQRITARYHLMPLDRAETEAYVRHRLAVAGAARSPFSRLGLRTLYRRSGGVPRVINVVADRTLMAGFAREQESLGERLIDRAADETLPGHARYWMHRYGRWLAAGAVLALAAGAASWHWLNRAPAVAEAVAKPAPPPPDTALASLRNAIAHTPDANLTAWTQLLGRWQVNSAQVSVRDAAHCPGTIAAGLACLRGTGTLEQLARFDRPLILTLRDGNSGVDALLLGVDAQHVKLALGGQTRTLKKPELAHVWNGEFSAVWELPAGIPATLQTGDAGPGVAWIKAQLARMDGGKADDTGPAYFDAALEERVRKLQTAYGIKPDGIVGPETLFALSALSESGPHLYRAVQ